MPESSHRRIETEALVIGYAMSRLDSLFLQRLKFKTWTGAFEAAGSALHVPASSIKNLRDEFDPFHTNQRTGWNQRPIRQDRLRIMTELYSVSDEALFELVLRIINREQENISEAIEVLMEPSPILNNVAERLLTGRKAEDYFIGNYISIIQRDDTNLIDIRNSACGYDFGIDTLPEIAIEIKGLKKSKGNVQFTDKEWQEANIRKSNYWLVVIGNILTEPRASVIYDPATNITVTCRYQKTISASWNSMVSI